MPLYVALRLAHNAAVSWLFSRMYDGMMREVEHAGLSRWRAKLLAAAQGRVLEIGAGTGANLPYYTRAVEELVVAEPNPHMRARLRERISRARFKCRVLDDSAERISFPDHSFDAVVSTLVLCSVPELDAALAELHRVLKPGGQLLFIEHVAAHENHGRARWQRRIEPLWRRFAGNCHLTRDTTAAITRAGFAMEELQRESMRKAMPLVRPSVRGIARA